MHTSLSIHLGEKRLHLCNISKVIGGCFSDMTDETVRFEILIRV